MVKLICIFYQPLRAEGYVKEATNLAMKKQFFYDMAE